MPLGFRTTAPLPPRNPDSRWQSGGVGRAYRPHPLWRARRLQAGGPHPRRCRWRSVRQGGSGSRPGISRRTGIQRVAERLPAVAPADHAHDDRYAMASAALPRAWMRNTLDFSFSGVKTALLHRAQNLGLYPPADAPDPTLTGWYRPWPPSFRNLWLRSWSPS